jgi:hypothetical protein
MEIKKIYTVNGIEYTDLKQAKAAQSKFYIESFYGKEIADKMFADEQLISMLHSVKVGNKKPKAVKEVKVPKVKKAA